MVSDEELQTKWVQLQYLEEQIKVLQTQLAEIDRAIEELSILKVGLQNIEETGNEEVLVPLGASVYVKGKLEGAGRVIVGIGAGVFVEKTISDALPIVDQQVENLRRQEELLVQNISLINSEAEKLTREINKAVADRNAGLPPAEAF